MYEQSTSKIPNKEYRNSKNGYVYTYNYLFYETLKLDHDLSAGYEILQDLLKKSYIVPDNKLRDFFINMSNKLTQLTDENMIKVGNTIKKWLDYIVASYTSNAVNSKLTNAKAEGNNNHIKTLIKITYGLNNFERMRKRCLIISKNSKKRW